MGQQSHLVGRRGGGEVEVDAVLHRRGFGDGDDADTGRGGVRIGDVFGARLVAPGALLDMFRLSASAQNWLSVVLSRALMRIGTSVSGRCHSAVSVLPVVRGWVGATPSLRGSPGPRSVAGAAHGGRPSAPGVPGQQRAGWLGRAERGFAVHRRALGWPREDPET